jgi:hypothetical protein
MTYVPPAPSPPPGGWYQRNRRWFLPLVIAGPVLLVVLAVGFVVGIFAVVMGSMKASGAYQQALKRVRSDPAVVQAIGRPVRPGRTVWGNINVSGPNGSASMSFPVSGPKGEGRVFVDATKTGGVWTLDSLSVEIEGRPGRLVLVGPGAEAPARGP